MTRNVWGTFIQMWNGVGWSCELHRCPAHLPVHADIPQNQRMVEVGMDLWGSYCLTSCSSRATLSSLPRAMSRLLLCVFKDGDSTSSLSDPCQCSVPHSKKVFPGVQREHPVSHLVPIASSSVTGHCSWGLALSSLQSPFDYLYILMRCPSWARFSLKPK